MKYVVLETQTNIDGTIGTLVTTYDEQNDAESKYHLILSYAAVSTLPKHCAFLLTDTGRVLKSDAYIRNVITAEEDNNGDA